MLMKKISILMVIVGSFMAASLPLHAEETISIVIRTNAGNIEAELYPSRAPITVANFVDNIGAGLYEGGHFYRAVSSVNSDPSGNRPLSLIQGGKNQSKVARPPIVHETTRVTGILHTEAVLSMARRAPGTANSEFFISIGDNPILDHRISDGERSESPGYASFGKVTKGMDLVRHIQASATGSRKLSEQEKKEAPNWILPQLLNDSVVITNIEIIN